MGFRGGDLNTRARTFGAIDLSTRRRRVAAVVLKHCPVCIGRFLLQKWAAPGAEQKSLSMPKMKRPSAEAASTR